MAVTIRLRDPWQLHRMDQIAAGQTYEADRLPIQDFHVQRYVIRIKVPSQSKYLQLDLSANEDGGEIYDTVFAKVGSPLNISVNFLLDVTDALLQIVNNESFTVDVHVFKIIE